MRIRAGFSLTYDCPAATPMLLTLNIHPSRERDLLTPQVLAFSSQVESRDYVDSFGNMCTRLIAPAEQFTVSTLFDIHDWGLPDAVPSDAWQHDIRDLPDDTLAFLLGSRYCDTERLSATAWNLFEGTPPGWARVQAIVDFTHNQLRFDLMRADATRTAFDAYHARVGVCRDFAHLAITLCRCMNIPARYCTGYMGDIGIPPNPDPMDFSAWFEVYLGGRWHTADAKTNRPRIGRILMARGRDATDVALSTQFGPAMMSAFKVITDEIAD